MYRFTKQSRLLNKTDYDRVFNQAKKAVTPYFIILYRNNEIGRARLGLALSKKMIAKSHDRNRLKRLSRETFRLHALPAIDIIILARSGVAMVDNAVIISKFNQVWDKLCKD